MTSRAPSLSRRHAVAALASGAAVAVATGAVFALRPFAPVLSLGVLYLFAVLPVAALWGLGYATAVSLVSMLAFNWLFLPPRHTFRLAESENWVALAVYLVTAVSVSGLAARARRRAAEAEQQRSEASFAAEVSTLLLERPDVRPQLPEIAARAADLLRVPHCRIELDVARPPGPDEDAHVLSAGGRELGRVVLAGASHPEPAVTSRVLAVLSSLLATAIEREHLARSDTAKTVLLRSVSHDLRSPLTAISAATEVLAGQDEPLSRSERAELLGSIELQVRRLDRLVGNLLDLSRLEADAAKPLPELWPIDSLIARALEALGPGSERVLVSLPADSVTVSVDATQLEHALVNLLENALKHCSPSDPVEVEAERVDGQVVVRVRDRGPGVALGEQAAIFEPFQRGTGAAGHGSGLGLAIARGFAEVNNGRLWVESEPGKGATFSLALPAVEIPSEVRE